jgi:radical SAM protein (TIGR01212 family)
MTEPFFFYKEINKNNAVMKNPYYYSASDYYKDVFGEKVYKISLDAGCTCPTRDGTKGTRGCIFCSSSGSGDFAANRNKSITDQITDAKLLVSKKIKSQNPKYIAYFQNFTNTYGDTNTLIAKYNEALQDPTIVGISIATRPDSISDSILYEIGELAKKTYVSIELGLQTIHPKSSTFIRRGYDLSEYTLAMNRIKAISSKIHIVTHIIFGLPSETTEEMLDTVRFCVNSKTDGIKIALLHVLKGTDLEPLYKAGQCKCMTLEEYLPLICSAVKIIPKTIVIHRLTGDGPKSLLIAPLWTADKKNVQNQINLYFSNDLKST